MGVSSSLSSFDLSSRSPDPPPKIRERVQVLFTGRFSPLYSRMSTNIQREICDFLGLYRYFPVICSRLLSLYDIDSAAVTNIEYTRAVVWQAIFILADDVSAFAVGDYVEEARFISVAPHVTPHVTNSLSRISLRNRQITEEPSMRKARLHPGVVKLGHFLFVFGSEYDDSSKSVERFDIAHKLWTDLPDMWAARCKFIPCAHGFNVYLVSSGTPVDEFNTITQTFTRLSLCVPTDLLGSVPYITDGELVVACPGCVYGWTLGGQDSEMTERDNTGSDPVVVDFRYAPLCVGKYLLVVDQHLKIQRLDLRKKTFIGLT